MERVAVSGENWLQLLMSFIYAALGQDLDDSTFHSRLPCKSSGERVDILSYWHAAPG